MPHIDREMSGECQGILQCLESGHPALALALTLTLTLASTRIKFPQHPFHILFSAFPLITNTSRASHKIQILPIIQQVDRDWVRFRVSVLSA